MGVGGSPFGCNERRCWANRLCSLFQRFPTYVITIHQSYRRTDRQTDRRHAIPRPRICTKVHCAVKTKRTLLYRKQPYVCSENALLSNKGSVIFVKNSVKTDKCGVLREIRRWYVGSFRSGAGLRRSYRERHSCRRTDSRSSVFYRIPRQIQGPTRIVLFYIIAYKKINISFIAKNYSKLANE